MATVYNDIGRSDNILCKQETVATVVAVEAEVAVELIGSPFKIDILNQGRDSIE